MNNRQTAEFEILADKMDKREKVYAILKGIEDKNQGAIPVKYANDKKFLMAYEEYKTFGSWRNRPNIVQKLIKTAKKTAKNQKKRK